MVEQRSPKPTVEGSSPSAPAIKAPFLGFFSFWPLQEHSSNGRTAVSKTDG